MGLMAPASLGGEGASLGEVADVCYALGRACASTAMIYAMHQVKVACVVRHGVGERLARDFMRPLGADQLLLASSTTEGQGGGNVRSSEAPVELRDGRISLERDASVISYGAEADAVVTTARRAADAAASDQVLLCSRQGDYTLEATLSWDTLGMRGTCSAGFTLRATADPAQILPVPYGAHPRPEHGAGRAYPVVGVWAGIAAGAVERARRYLRKAARRGGELPPAAAYFSRAKASLRALRALMATMTGALRGMKDDRDALAAMEFQTAINLLKVDASELAVETVMSALRAAGFPATATTATFSIGRHLRDVLSSPIMINNDRILANVGPTAAAGRVCRKHPQ